MDKALKAKAQKIKLLITDCDGVLTDSCVYYSAKGEELKKFSLRDGMGTERLRNLCNIDSGIMTRENSEIVARRAEKLKMKHYYPGVFSKKEKLLEILKTNSFTAEEIAYIGDDENDREVLEMVGLSACPLDAVGTIPKAVHYHCQNAGGHGAFREFAELIIELRK